MGEIRIPFVLKHRISKIKNLIRQYGVDKKIRQLASSILTKKQGEKWAIAEKDYKKEIYAIYRWVQANIRYQRDPSIKDIIESPFETLRLRIADCDGMATLLGSLLVSVGYPVKIKLIQQKHLSREYHIYVIVGIPPGKPTKWIGLDATFNKGVGYEPPNIGSTIINI